MSRRPSSSLPRNAASASAPYSRRAPGQPKSSRQQFSACGACRMRRVRCDLKDCYAAAMALEPPSCSNCRERGIRCVDEFADIKAVKLLRRGRRLQQAEAVYGKVADDIPAVPSLSQGLTSPFSATTATINHNHVPQMQLAFLRSSFFRIFCVQRPVIEPGEFVSRYLAHMEGTIPLNTEGQMLAMVLVTWAASFGINEFGEEDVEDTAPGSNNSHFALDDDSLPDPKRRARMLRTEAMTREILALVDLHGLLRRPSWDGVRVLLLLLPLTHDIQSPLERLTTYEATLLQVRSLCNLENAPSVNSELGPYCDILVRCRIFWYAFAHEGITTGLNGGHLLLDDIDLSAFQNSLPPQHCASAAHSIAPLADSPGSSTASSSPVTPNFPFNTPLEASHPRAALAYLVTTQYFSLALAVAQACRAIQSTLTGPLTRRRAGSGAVMCKEAVMEIWDNLEHCWNDFEALRRNPSGVGAAGGDLLRGEDVERFVSGWQVFIFGCFNVIREALFNHIKNNDVTIIDPTTASILHVSAIRRCQKYLPRVIKVLQRHLTVPSNFFAYDAGLIRDGCFFAGLLLAQSDEADATRDTIGWDADWEEGVTACLQALGEIRWAYSRGYDREKSLKAEWEARIQRDIRRRRPRQSPIPFPIKQSPDHSPCLSDDTPLPYSTGPDFKPRTLSLVSAAGQTRPHLSPLSVSFPCDDSGPDTVLTDGSSSWEAYTPPTTSSSMAGTVVTHGSLSPVSSPLHPTMGLIHDGMKSKVQIFDEDQFSFSIADTSDSRRSVEALSARWTPFSHNYLDPRVILTAPDIALGATMDSHHFFVPPVDHVSPKTTLS